MSKNKKKKKQSRMSDATKENIKLGASSLVSNAAVVELGQKKPWYGAIITAVLAVILAVIPILTLNYKSNGSDVLKTPSYGFETGLVHFQQDLKASGKDVTFEVKDGSLSVKNWNEFLSSDQSGATDDEPWYHHYNEVTKRVDFAVFVTDDEGEAFSKYATNVYSGINPLTGAKIGSTTTVNVGANETTNSAAPTTTAQNSNTLIFGKNTFRVMKANANGEWKEGSAKTLWDYSAGELPIKKLVASSTTNAEAMDTYITETRKAWATYFDKAFENQRNINAWSMVGTMAGIYTFFIAFMGLLIFIMTRGKNNPYRIYTFWMTQKMAYWGSFTPALLAMIIGFFVNREILFFLFIFLFGLRIMWLSMKTLRPQA